MEFKSGRVIIGSVFFPMVGSISATVPYLWAKRTGIGGKVKIIKNSDYDIYFYEDDTLSHYNRKLGPSIVFLDGLQEWQCERTRCIFKDGVIDPGGCDKIIWGYLKWTRV